MVVVGGGVSRTGLRKSQRPTSELCLQPCQVPYKLEITVHIIVTVGNLKQLVFMSTFKI